ncbi:calcium/sodium antiporter [Patescibacteria group bacterium]|nr:calcium/sodium antiporter [Patescibacteria group bacterium]MBU1124016.1 calcium/sodium antiporter [Patescibacteria group bacterium]MBU1911238.1 calcium/sodium antiporter [Patescibacteria group bacterium]
MLLATLSIILGFVLLIKGADWLVDGATVISRRLGVSDLVIGLTVVSFGTSAPELIVNLIASFQGSSDIAIGNIVGSNISNTLLILGITAIVAPLVVQRSTVLKEIPLNLLAAFMLFVLANDFLMNGYAISELSRSDGIVFLGFFIIFIYYTFGIRHDGVQEDLNQDKKVTKPTRPLWIAYLLVVIGCAGLALGGKLAVDGAISIAKLLHISEALVGLTIVAVGTSLPELAASVVAAHKGKADIAVGNIVGSNIFNIFWILGLSSIIKPLTFTPATNLDLYVVLLSTLLLFFIIHNGAPHRRLLMWWSQSKDYIIRRWEGGVLLGSYFIYIAYIVWRG